jgi:hypothetical protein
VTNIKISPTCRKNRNYAVYRQTSTLFAGNINKNRICHSEGATRTKTKPLKKLLEYMQVKARRPKNLLYKPARIVKVVLESGKYKIVPTRARDSSSASEDVFAYNRRIKGGFDQTFYQQVIGASNAFKEGDQAIGVGAED